MYLGSFSVSLTVKDIKQSQEFYEKIGFVTMGGDIEQKWLILRNGETTIGLYEGMFDYNLLTFNPGWDKDANNLDEFTDIRDIQKELVAKGIEFEKMADETTKGPEHFIIVDPDGNTIMLDQHR